MALTSSPAPPAGVSAVLTPSLSPDRLGARGALKFSIGYAGTGESGKREVPTPVRRFVVRFPAGMGLDIPNLSSCTARRLLARGPRSCPPSSQVGRGYALTEVQAGSLILSEDVSLWAFLGPLQNGHSTLEILGRGYTPLEERLLFTGTLLLHGRAPYEEELVVVIPPLPTLAFAPNASIVTFSLTIGTSMRRSSRSRRSSRQANTVIVPSRCPVGGFPFLAESIYADGSSGSASAMVPCPPKPLTPPFR